MHLRPIPLIHITIVQNDDKTCEYNRKIGSPIESCGIFELIRFSGHVSYGSAIQKAANCAESQKIRMLTVWNTRDCECKEFLSDRNPIVGLAVASGKQVKVKVLSSRSALEEGRFTGEVVNLSKVGREHRCKVVITPKSYHQLLGPFATFKTRSWHDPLYRVELQGSRCKLNLSQAARPTFG